VAVLDAYQWDKYEATVGILRVGGPNGEEFNENWHGESSSVLHRALPLLYSTGYKGNERPLAKSAGIDCICANSLNQYFVPIMAQCVLRYCVAGLTWFRVCELVRLFIYCIILVTSYRLNGLVV
jgi:hypothetical protein